MCEKNCADLGYTDVVGTFYPNVSGIRLTPRSSFVRVRRNNKDPEIASLQLIPDISRDHFYLTITEAIVLKPLLPYTCSGIKIGIDHPVGYSQMGLLQTKAVLSAKIRNTGKVAMFASLAQLLSSSNVLLA